MKHLIISLAAAIALAAPGPSWAGECYADYKAKQDSPLRLHYGVLKLSGACAPGPARTEAATRLANGGWALLNVLSIFGPEGLSERKANAGPYFLRF